MIIPSFSLIENHLLIITTLAETNSNNETVSTSSFGNFIVTNHLTTLVFSSKEYFKKWHKDHVKCSWIKGEPFEIGSILYVGGYMHNSSHKMKFLGIKNEFNRNIEYRLLFSISIVYPRISFTINPKNDTSIFTATFSFRFGWFFQKFMKSRAEAITLI